MRLRRKKWAPEMIQEHKDIALNLDSLTALPPCDSLEIGSGRGKFLMEKALANPSHHFLGIEINYNAFSLAIKRAQDERYKQMAKNYAFVNAPMEKVMPFISKESLDSIFLNFSDPWPKKRQYKRRLTYPTRLEEYYQKLKKGGKLYFKTDNLDLFQASETYFKDFGKFKILFDGPYLKDDPDDVMTEFEEKFRNQGLPIYRIVAVKEEA